MQWVKEHLSLVSFILQSKSSEFTFTNCFLTCFAFYRCWFGKEPGKYIDYIYQGPVILVLLVSVCVGGRTLPSPTERKFDLSCSTSAFMKNKTQTRPNIFRCSLKWITLQELKWFGFGCLFGFGPFFPPPSALLCAFVQGSERWEGKMFKAGSTLRYLLIHLGLMTTAAILSHTLFLKM